MWVSLRSDLRVRLRNPHDRLYVAAVERFSRFNLRGAEALRRYECLMLVTEIDAPGLADLSAEAARGHLAATLSQDEHAAILTAAGKEER